MLFRSIWLIRSSTHPNLVELANRPGTEQFRDFEDHPDDTTFPGLLILRIYGGLFFATADTLHDQIREMLDARQPPIRTLVIDCRSLNFIDSQGADKLRELHELAERHGIVLHLSRLKPKILDILTEDGLLDLYGEDNLLDDTYQAVMAHIKDTG